MNVLSLFDGMSCGQLALKKLGISVDNYYASEIDKYAIKVTQENFPETIQLGDINDWKKWNLPKIDLMLAGSPCQGFSFAGKQLNFNDPRSALFFKFVDMLKFHKPKNFLLENVKMKKEYEQVITNTLGVKPILLNSSDFSAQSRPRLYWTNIEIGAWLPRGITLQNVIQFEIPFDQKPYIENYRSNRPTNWKADKFPTLRANAGSRTRGIGICDDAGYWRKLTPSECEELQTVPIGYTAGVSNTQRYKMLGNGWTVDVIAHIMKGIS